MMGTDHTQDAPERCPVCLAALAADGACEVYAEARSSDHGLRFDIQCECGNCGAKIILEDISASGGTLGKIPKRSTFQFNGEGYPA